MSLSQYILDCSMCGKDSYFDAPPGLVIGCGEHYCKNPGCGYLITDIRFVYKHNK